MVSCLATLIGEAAARADSAARKIAVVCMSTTSCLCPTRWNLMGSMSRCLTRSSKGCDQRKWFGLDCEIMLWYLGNNICDLSNTMQSSGPAKDTQAYTRTRNLFTTNSLKATVSTLPRATEMGRSWQSP